MKRREFVAAALAGALLPRSLLAEGSKSRVSISSTGKLVHESSIAGEQRRDGSFPAHPNGIRLSRDRYLFLYATRGWRGVDEDRSIIYQLRAGDFNGPILREGLLAKTIDDWDPLDDGGKYFKAHGHPCGFGVPKGALVGGRPAPHANLFVLKWYQYARPFSGADRVERPLADRAQELGRRTRRIQWVHVRLNEAEDDIEILEPATSLRAPDIDGIDAERFNQTYVQPVPFNDDATEWIDLFMPPDLETSGGGPVPVKFRYDPQTHRYAWTATGPQFFSRDIRAGEGGAVRLRDGWGLFARPQKDSGLPLLWVRAPDPFTRAGAKVLEEPRAGQPLVRGPVSAYHCPDGVIRVFSGDRAASPYDNRRHPLYCWEADPDADFALSHRQVVFDILAANRGIRPESEPIADMPKLLPHRGGRSQWLVHRFRTESINYDRDRPNVAESEPHFRFSPAVTETERDAHGIYLARLDYDRSLPGEWAFPTEPPRV